MAWRPSKDIRLARVASNPFWGAIETLYDEACAMASLPRLDHSGFDLDYVHVRKGDRGHDSAAMLSRLPAAFHSFRLGPTEIDLIDFLLNVTQDRALNLTGYRGAGKTTLLRYVESVTHRALPETFPIFVIVDCLALDDNARTETFVQKLQMELMESVPLIQAHLAAPFTRAALRLERSRTSVDAQESIAKLMSELSSDDQRRLFVVFDNLDHLHVSTVCIALELARALVVASKIGCVAFLRPGSLTGAFGRGDPQAFFGLQIRVSPPDVEAWLVSIERRIAAACQAFTDGGLSLSAYGKTITASDIRKSIATFTTLLQGRRADDDPIGFLDALAADDIRHLAKLVRRTLSHRSLPGEYLLGASQDGVFHPLPAMFEGQLVLFEGDEFVPNVLYHETREGAPDFLLPHRILTLLAEYAPVKTYSVLAWLEAIGVPRVDTIMCIDRLQRALLIRCSDSEVIDMSRALPEELLLTAAGSQYVNEIFAMGDYLLTAIVDVPLRHVSLRLALGRHLPEEAFAPRLESLLEYVEEVRKQEERQLRLLSKLGASRTVARVVDALRRGGLLSRALEEGLRNIVGRNRSSSYVSVKDAVLKASTQLSKLSKWLDGAEERLNEVLNRSGRLYVEAESPLMMKDGDAEMSIVPRAIGSEVVMQIDIRAPASRHSIAIILRAQSDGAGFVDGVMPLHKVHGGQDVGLERSYRSATLRGVIPVTEATFSLHNTEFGAEAMELGTTPRGKRRAVLFVSEDNDDYVQLRLAVEGEDFDHELGGRVSGEPLRTKAREMRDRVGEVVCGDGDPGDILAAAGERLRSLCMTDVGKNLLSKNLAMIGQLVIAVQEKNLEVPWEWMCWPASVGADTEFIRWPANPALNVFRLARLSSESAPCHSLMTFGLPTEEVWRRGVPTKYSELVRAADADVIHLVAECEDGTLTLGSLKVDDALVSAFPVTRPRHLMLSACEAASYEQARSAVVAFARRSKCVVWAPTVRIVKQQAEAIDRALEKYIRESTDGATIESFMRDAGRPAVLQVYIRYAFGR